MKVTVICRSCAHEQVVDVGEPGSIIDGFYDPDACGCCQSTDLSSLASFTRPEIDALLEEIARGEAA